MLTIFGCVCKHVFRPWITFETCFYWQLVAAQASIVQVETTSYILSKIGKIDQHWFITSLFQTTGIVLTMRALKTYLLVLHKTFGEPIINRINLPSNQTRYNTNKTMAVFVSKNVWKYLPQGISICPFFHELSKANLQKMRCFKQWFWDWHSPLGLFENCVLYKCIGLPIKM